MEHTTWVEVSREALIANTTSVIAHAGVPVCAVVKANAYGHGLVDTARAFLDGGAAMLGVSRIEEARAIRAAGIDAPVLLMMPERDPAEAVSLGCDITVSSVEAIGALPAEARVHVKVDTGMGRLGVAPSETTAAARAIAEKATLEAVWTHFADAAGPGGVAQLARFAGIVASLRSHGITAAAHAANSAALLALPDARFDMVRIGTLLYGQDPPGAHAPWTHRETFAWYARVAATRIAQPGDTIGYGSEWRAKRPTRIATIPIGYADGFMVEPNARTPGLRNASRALARAARGLPRSVTFDEGAAPVLGRIAMQATSVDVTDLPGVTVGTRARIPARRLMVSAAIPRVMR